MLDKLKADERARLLEASRGDTTRISTADIPVSGRAAAAVRFAMAQIGKAYVYGAAGPSAFDCSGLTMAAWGSGRASASRTPPAPSTAPARTSRRASCSPVTWSSTTARSATSACTSATA